MWSFKNIFKTFLWNVFKNIIGAKDQLLGAKIPKGLVARGTGLNHMAGHAFMVTFFNLGMHFMSRNI